MKLDKYFWIGVGICLMSGSLIMPFLGSHVASILFSDAGTGVGPAVRLVFFWVLFLTVISIVAQMR